MGGGGKRVLSKAGTKEAGISWRKKVGAIGGCWHLADGRREITLPQAAGEGSWDPG